MILKLFCLGYVLLIALVAIRKVSYVPAAFIPLFLLLPAGIQFHLGMSINAYHLSLLLLFVITFKKITNKNRLIKRNDGVFKRYLAYILIMSLLPSIVNMSFGQYVSNMLSFFLDFILIGLVCNHILIDEKSIRRFDIVLLGCAVIIILYGSFNYVIHFNPYQAYLSQVLDSEVDMSNAFQAEVRGIIKGRISSTFPHPLQLGQCCLLIMSYFSFHLYRKNKSNILFYCLMGALMVMTFLTGSRSSLFPLAVLIAIFYAANNYKKILKYCFIGLFLFVMAYPALPSDFRETIEAMVMVWNQDKSNDAGVKGSSVDLRFAQLERAYDALGPDGMIIGKGKGFVNKRGHDYPEMHGYESIFLSELFDNGILGIIAYLLFYMALYKNLYRLAFNKESRYRVHALFVPFLFSSIFTGICFSFITFFLLLYFVVAHDMKRNAMIYYSNKNSKRNKDV